MRFITLLLLGLCDVCSYVVVLGLSVRYTVLERVTVMSVLLFVLHVSMVRECDGNAGVVVVSSGHQYVGGTRGSGIVSCAADGARDECGAWDERS